jgi:hypothetical protein
LLPRGQKAEFNLTEFLRPNQNARFNAYATGLSSGFLTVDEVREMEGMTPLDEQPAPTAEEPIA